MFLYLRHRTKQATALQGNTEQLNRLNRVVIYMVIYPFVYIVLSLPLAVGRMFTESRVVLDKHYFAFAGSLMACSGFVDVLVYALTRRRLVLESDVDDSQNLHSFYTITCQTHISAAGGKEDSNITRRFRKNSSNKLGSTVNDGQCSTDEIIRDEDMELDEWRAKVVFQETTFEISHEPANN